MTMPINKDITVYTFEDKEYIQEQLEILIRNDESLYQAEDFVFRGAYRQDIKGNLIMQKLVTAYDRHCIYPAIKSIEKYSYGDTKIKLKPAERRVIARAIIDEYYTNYYKLRNSERLNAAK